MEILETLGLTKEELAERIVDRAAERLLESNWFDEEGDEFSHDSQFSRAMQQHVKRKIDEAVEAIAGRHVLPNVETYVENLCLQETNRWGERVGKPVTFIEYLVARAEHYLTEKVDYEGKGKDEANGFSWNGTQTRLTHLVQRHLHFSIETAMKEAIANANAIVVGGIEKTVKLKLDEIAKQLKVQVKTR